MLDAKEITFGVEIETYVNRGQWAMGSYHAGRQLSHSPAGWNGPVCVVQPILFNDNGSATI